MSKLSGQRIMYQQKVRQKHGRTEYAEAIELNNHRVDTLKEHYNQRQAICEHPFGRHSPVVPHFHWYVPGFSDSARL